MARAIGLQGVGKLYRKLEERPTLLRTLMPFGRPKPQDLWALRDIDLEVEQGESLGVIGHNGAGKTTLLRLLAGVTSPTTGRVRVDGRIGPLISLGVGFHDEMSGRENVLVNGMLLGLTAKEVSKRFDQIVEFAELDRFIDTPVKFYSSGMVMRLGFAVMAHTEPTILLVDEILAVGDARFQLKCFDRLRALQAQGATIVMVSHAMYMVRQLCSRGVLIRHGRIEYDGDLDHAITLHEESFAGSGGRSTDSPVEFLENRLLGPAAENRSVAYDDPVELELWLRFEQEIKDPVILVGVMTSAGMLAGFNVTPPGREWRTFSAGEETTVRVSFRARLGGGQYRIAVEVRDRSGTKTLASGGEQMLVVESRPGREGFADVCAEMECAEPSTPRT